MAENSNIEWTEHTFNPWRGCQKVSPACKNCYAETRSNRFGENFSRHRIVLSDSGWNAPVKWNKEFEKQFDLYDRHGSDDMPRRPRVFCASLADVFEDWKGPIVSSGKEPVYLGKDGRASNDRNSRMTMDDLRSRLFRLIDVTPNLDWLLLTKRPENVRHMWTGGRRENVWLGTTVENQEQFDNRIEDLYNLSDLCSVRFLSCEPLLSSIDLSLPQIPVDWVIAGGESGPNARPSHPDWYRSLRDQCESAGVPFHFKQWGAWGQCADGDWHGLGPVGTPKQLAIAPGGRTAGGFLGAEIPPAFKGAVAVQKLGKKNTGRLLDGVEHNDRPELAPK